MLRGVFRSTDVSLQLRGAALSQCRRLAVLFCCPSFVINTEVGGGGGGRDFQELGAERGTSFVTVRPILAVTGFSWLTEVCSR